VISRPSRDVNYQTLPGGEIIYPIPVPGRFGLKKSRNLINNFYSVQPMKHYIHFEAGPLYGSTFLKHIILGLFTAEESVNTREKHSPGCLSIKILNTGSGQEGLE
jgi:hypothetical protein